MVGDQVENPEIVLAQGPPPWLGQSMWAGALVLLCWLTVGFSRSSGLPPWSDPFWLAALLFCGVSILLRFRFGRDIRWSIGSNEIGIYADNDLYRLLKRGDVLEIGILDQKSADRFRIQLCCVSGRRFKSPPVEGAQRAHELKAEIARRLGVTNT